MFYHKETNKYIYENVPFEINGVQYPANWLNLSSPEEKLAAGLIEVIITNPPEDSNYYTVISHLENGVETYENIPKDLSELKQNSASEITLRAHELLKLSDWIVIRSMEPEGEPIPQAWINWRKSVRDLVNSTIAAIENSKTIDELKAAKQIDWPLDPSTRPF